VQLPLGTCPKRRIGLLSQKLEEAHNADRISRLDPIGVIQQWTIAAFARYLLSQMVKIDAPFPRHPYSLGNLGGDVAIVVWWQALVPAEDLLVGR